MRLLLRFAHRNDTLFCLGTKNTFYTLNPEEPDLFKDFFNNYLKIIQFPIISIYIMCMNDIFYLRDML